MTTQEKPGSRGKREKKRSNRGGKNLQKKKTKFHREWKGFDVEAKLVDVFAESKGKGGKGSEVREKGWIEGTGTEGSTGFKNFPGGNKTKTGQKEQERRSRRATQTVRRWKSKRKKASRKVVW